MSSSGSVQQVLGVVGDALRRGDMAAAMRVSEEAVARGLAETNILALAGHACLERGDLDRALALLTRARELDPNNIEAHNGLGLCLGMMGRGRDAVAVFDAALARWPGALNLILNRAQPLEDLGRLREAQTVLEKVLAADPNNTQALERLANLCARRGEMAAARGYATRALKLAPLPGATIALATAELADKNYARVQQLLEPLIADAESDPVNRSIALGLTGDALDGMDRTADAFAAYAQARQALRAPLTAMQAGRESAVAHVRRLAAYFRAAPTQPWRTSTAGTAPVATHVFLVGFPRSGTTLLEQALASHRDVRTMEEVDCLGDAAGEFFFAQGGMDRFAALGEAELDRLRALYWNGVAESGAQTDRAVFIDKLPLNSIHQGLIARLFPSAKILFALRDPRDVVFSCFRRRLVMSANAVELSSLDGTAAFYDAVMDISRVYRDTLALSALDLRHEDMIGDFAGEMRRVCAFLGLSDDAAMNDFASHARNRDIKTPSAAQVVRGLSKDGAGQWKRYAAELAPIMTVLAPWIERFGYKDI